VQDDAADADAIFEAVKFYFWKFFFACGGPCMPFHSSPYRT
jgi:hypothetical protein